MPPAPPLLPVSFNFQTTNNRPAVSAVNSGFISNANNNRNNLRSKSSSGISSGGCSYPGVANLAKGFDKCETNNLV